MFNGIPYAKNVVQDLHTCFAKSFSLHVTTTSRSSVCSDIDR